MSVTCKGTQSTDGTKHLLTLDGRGTAGAGGAAFRPAERCYGQAAVVEGDGGRREGEHQEEHAAEGHALHVYQSGANGCLLAAVVVWGLPLLQRTTSTACCCTDPSSSASYWKASERFNGGTAGSACRWKLEGTEGVGESLCGVVWCVLLLPGCASQSGKAAATAGRQAGLRQQRGPLNSRRSIEAAGHTAATCGGWAGPP